MHRSLFFGGLMLGLFMGCNQFDELENISGVTYDAEYAVPILNSSISIQDLLENFEEAATLQIDPDGQLRFLYSGDILTQTAADIFADFNQTLSQAGLIPIVQNRQALPFSTGQGVEFDRIELSGGRLIYYIKNTHSQPITATITIREATKDGMPLVIQRSLPAFTGQGEAPTSTNVFLPLDMSGYQVQPQNDSIYVEFTAVDPNGNMLPPAEGTGLLISGLNINYAEGYLGRDIYDGGRDTINIDFFDNWVRGDVYFEDPIINFYIENSFGIPTRSIVNTFNVFTVNGQRLPLESPLIDNGIDFPYPSLNEVGQTKQAAYVFDKSNSNIREVLGAGPVAIDYDVDAITNPDEQTSIRGFITDSSFYRVRVDVDLPLYGSAINFAANDTFPVDFTQYEDIKSVEFKLVTENSIPLAVDIQGYFLSDDNRILAALLDQPQRAVAGAPVGNDGLPTGQSKQIQFSDFPPEKFDLIRDAKKLVIQAAFSTTGEGQQSVRVRANQNLRVKLGAILGVEN